MTDKQTRGTVTQTGGSARDMLLYAVILLGTVLVLLAANSVMDRVRSREAASAPRPAVVEPIEGTDLKRVILTEGAAERIDLQTAFVREARGIRQREVGGQVVAMPEDGAGTLLVRVSLSEADLASVDRRQPALVFPLDDTEDDDEPEGLDAEAVDDIDDVDDVDDDMEETALFFSVRKGAQQALTLGQPVRVRLALGSSGAPRTVVPYAAVIYDVQGGTWVYTREPDSLAFVRHQIIIDYIEDDLAFLTEGPPVGTEVVTVGGALLYGAETGVSK